MFEGAGHLRICPPWEERIGRRGMVFGTPSLTRSAPSGFFKDVPVDLVLGDVLDHLTALIAVPSPYQPAVLMAHHGLRREASGETGWRSRV